MRTIALAACAALALAILTGGCGGAGAQGPGSADGAASVVPSDAIAFVAASTDVSSSDWHGVGTLLLQRLHISADDLRALAGDEVDVALMPGKRSVAFVQPTDDAKLAAFAKQHDQVTRRFGDWTAVAKDTATLDAVAGAKAHLADNTVYLDAMNHLPGNTLARAYLSGDEAHALFASVPGQLETRQIPVGAKFRLKRDRPGTPATLFGVGTQGFRWVAAAVTSSSAGLKLQALAASGGLTAASPPRLVIRPIAPYVSGLVDEIPSGALAVIDAKLSSGAFELLPSLPAPLEQLFGSPPDLANKLDAVLGGETALYVRPAAPMPEFTLVTQPADTATAQTTIDELVAAAPSGSPLETVALHRAIIGGQLVVSTSEAGIDAFRSGGAKLSADPAFLEAKKDSGMPDATTGFVYVDAKSALPLLALAGVKLPANAPDLKTFTAYGAQQSDGSTFTAFLGVR
jgi:hypothetical protein